MKRILPLLLFIVIISCISGWLMSKPSLVGRVGIALFYKQYHFLRIWWQGALAVCITLMVLTILQGWAHLKLSRAGSIWFQVLMILLAIAGFLYTWYDFQHTTTHRWLKERFHLGAYLFWLGMISISIFYLTSKKQIKRP